MVEVIRFGTLLIDLLNHLIDFYKISSLRNCVYVDLICENFVLFVIPWEILNKNPIVVDNTCCFSDIINHQLNSSNFATEQNCPIRVRALNNIYVNIEKIKIKDKIFLILIVSKHSKKLIKCISLRVKLIQTMF